MKRFWVFCLLVCSNFALFSEERNLYIMRHGESEHNLTHTYNSSLSLPDAEKSHLTEKGRGQAVETAKKLLSEGVNSSNVVKVFVSPLPRTLETAEILVKAGVFPESIIEVDLRLIEIQHGDLEGKEILPDWQPCYAEQYHTEKDEAIDQRIESLYRDLTQEPEGNVIVITHNILAQKLMKRLSAQAEKLPTGSVAGPFKL